MAIIEDIASKISEHTAWRHEIHSHPETAFEEIQTGDFVAAKLESFGIEVHRGLGRTGVVGVLQGNKGGEGSIGLRADMDALNLAEKNDYTPQLIKSVEKVNNQQKEVLFRKIIKRFGSDLTNKTFKT